MSNHNDTYIFLDDERYPHQVTWVDFDYSGRVWIVVRSYNEFVNLISSCASKPAFISFDHDLGPKAYKQVIENNGTFDYNKLDDEKTGYHCAKWLVDYCAQHGWRFPEYRVHSMNPIGKENIEQYIECYKRTME